MSHFDVASYGFADPKKGVNRKCGPLTVRLQSKLCHSVECPYFKKAHIEGAVVRSSSLMILSVFSAALGRHLLELPKEILITR